MVSGPTYYVVNPKLTIRLTLAVTICAFFGYSWNCCVTIRTTIFSDTQFQELLSVLEHIFQSHFLRKNITFSESSESKAKLGDDFC